MQMSDKKGRSFVTIMLIIAVSALLLRFAIEKIVKFTVSQNESYASLTLKFIAAGLENYAKNNQGAYPASFSALVSQEPKYLDKDYLALSPAKGYSFTCQRLEPSGYSCSAVPLQCRLTGNTVYTIKTGSLLISEQCSRKD